MDAINKLIVFLLDNLITVAMVTFFLVVMWTAIGTDATVEGKRDVGGLSKVVKEEMNSLVPSKN